MRGRRRRVGAQRRPRIPPSIPTAPIAKHRRRDAQFPCDLRQRPTAARQQGYCLPLELIGKLTTSLAHSTPSRSSSELSKGVHQFAGGSHLHEALLDGTTRDEAFELIRSLIDEICLVPEDGQLRVELRGELAGILALAADSRKPGGLSATGLAQQIKMVAGTGNQHCLDEIKLVAGPRNQLYLLFSAY